MKNNLNINFFFYLKNFEYFNENLFENFCSYLKSLNYLFIKFNYNVIIESHISKIKKILNMFDLKLIIKIDEKQTKINKYADYIEIKDINSNFNKENLILNIPDKCYNKIKNKSKYFQIIINDIHNLRWDCIKKYKNIKNIGIEFQSDDVNKIYFTSFGIKNLHIVHNSFPNILQEWSKINLPSSNNIEYNFNNIFKDQKKILITGITGQDGSNLVEYLINNEDNIIIFGTLRSILVLQHTNIKKFILNNKFIPIILDLCDENNTKNVFKNIKPDYFFNCAAQSVVNKDDSFSVNTLRVNTIAPLIHLECIREFNKKCRYFSCGSCEEFGTTKYKPQNINHPCEPINIYGISKLATRNIIKYYRNKYNLFLCHGILYNHEGIKRGKEFVSRKITNKVVLIKKSLLKKETPEPLEIGNIFSTRDWADSEDFVKAFWKILNIDKPNDYILSYGQSNTVKNMITIAFNAVNIKINWKIDKNNPLNTKAYYKNKIMVKINKNFYREIDNNRDFLGDNTETKKNINWEIEVSFKELIEKMVKNDAKLNNLIL